MRLWVGGHTGPVAGARVRAGIFLRPLLCGTLFKRDWLAAAAASLPGIWIEGGLPRSEQWLIVAAFYLAIYFAPALVMPRFGLLAPISTLFFLNSFQNIVPGFEWTAWYAPSGLATLVFLLTIAIGAFWRSLGSRSLSGDEAA